MSLGTPINVVLRAGIEGFLWGAFVVLRLGALYLVVQQAWNCHPHPFSLRTTRDPLVYGSFILLILLVGHWIFTMCWMVQATSSATTGVPPMFNIMEPEKLLRVGNKALVALSAIAVDALLTWRLWIVSNRKRDIILPLVFIVSFLGCAIGGTIIVGQTAL
ncbi:hypothetical protein FA15DRAFT_670340 [Coprinopsis marcescibilis]|uniref:Uncharacterized protein n=1 Tax=Coprinopsis marcescibilis TaxID=230819 RepID=A0A5C3KT50_COPMA|nr:hypothetical protein FA15DRAFT_670340 [Coprinopsis marcescibilis]